jgi:hypothetical protein
MTRAMRDRSNQVRRVTRQSRGETFRAPVWRSCWVANRAPAKIFVTASLGDEAAMRLARASQHAGAGAEFAFGYPVCKPLPRPPFRRYTGVSDSDKAKYAAA